ncbi:MAG: sigma-E processing peptidase SpoIIGA [Clostridiales bacterium]|nr:sigma-E processing peptidase SpoIIGA [Clostridiales bacterium]
MKYEWYPDVYFLVNFLMDSSALLLAAVSCNQRVSSARIFLASAAEVAVNMILLVCLPSRLLYVFLVYLVLHPATTVLAFEPKGARACIRLLAAVYVLLFLAGGVQQSLHIQFGSGGTGMILSEGILTALLFTLWQIRQRVFSRLCVVDLWFRGQRISLNAYCDSGNLLRHPKSRHPVSIVDRTALPEPWVRQLPPAEKIPCRTVSDTKAWMEVVPFDKMDVYLRGGVKVIQALQIGLQDGRLMQTPDVQMLLNGAFL